MPFEGERILKLDGLRKSLFPPIAGAHAIAVRQDGTDLAHYVQLIKDTTILSDVMH